MTFFIYLFRALRWDIALELVNIKVNVDQRDGKGDTAFFLAVREHHRARTDISLEVCRKIVELIDLNKLKDSRDRITNLTPRKLVLRLKMTDLAEFIRERLKMPRTTLRF